VKVLLVTNTGSTGIGGHLYTVRSHYEALRHAVDCALVGIGAVKSPAFDSLPGRTFHVFFRRGLAHFRELREFLKIVGAERPDVIHTFDSTACAFARVAAWRLGCGLVVTMCGGPNPEGPYPRAYFPQVDRLVLFSEENEQFFTRQPRFRRTKLWRIPNRVNEVVPDAEKIGRLRQRLRPGVPTVLRVGRISGYFGKTAAQAIALVKRLTQEGCPVQMLFVGVIQQAAARAAIDQALGPHGIVVSDAEFVTLGSAIVDVGDFVVGTGRSLMEAAARRRVLLAPTRDGAYPALVSETNWAALFRTNFSERGVVVPWDEEANYQAIRQVVLDPGRRQALAAFSRSLYEQHFALPPVMGRYLQLYGEARPPRSGAVWDLLRHWVWLAWATRQMTPRPGIVARGAEASGD
jgi:glycosyltransferase involved in cell wall biosynthesis